MNPRESNQLDTFVEQIREGHGSVEEMLHQPALCLQALDLVPEARSELWAELHHRLGRRQAQSPAGKPAQNLKEAISHYQQALLVFTLSDHPVRWASVQYWLGAAYQRIIFQERAANQEKALGCYENARQVFTDNAMPQEWADTTFRLANVYLQRIQQPKRENLDRAIALYEKVLQIDTHEASPVRWAEVQRNLGIAYRNYPWDDYATNVEKAIEHLQAALSELNQKDHGNAWASTQHALGTAWWSRTRGSREDNLSNAIDCYEQALQVRTFESSPVAWAETTHNLAAAYFERQIGDRVQNIERAIDLSRQVLKARSDEELPTERATTLNILANAYVKRIRGDRAENLEWALKYYEQASELREPVGQPKEWAITQLNRGIAYTKRIRGERISNLNEARGYLQQALSELTLDASPLEWAKAQSNLADACWNLGILERQNNREAADELFEKAICHCQESLQVYQRSEFPAKWALIQYLLGNAYADRITGDRQANLEAALNYYQDSLEERSEVAHPVERAQTLNNLAVTYLDLEHGLRKCNQKRAIEHFEDALRIHRQQGVRIEERRSAANLAHLYYGLRNWPKAYDTLQAALKVIERMRADAAGDLGQEDIAQENTQLYDLMLDTCLRRGPAYYPRALEAVEANRSRAFLAQMGTDRLPTRPLTAELQKSLEKEQQLVGQLRSYEDAIRTAGGEHRRLWVIQQQDKSRGVLHDVWSELEAVSPEYVALRRGDPIKYGQVQSMLDNGPTSSALIEFYTLPDRIIAFVLQASNYRPEIISIPFPRRQLQMCVDILRKEMKPPDQEAQGTPGKWQEPLEPLIKAILPHLKALDLLYFVPHGLLHYLPLHALQVNGDYLIDRLPIAYAPSAAVLGRVLQRADDRKGAKQPRALVAGDPTLDLPHARLEAEQVAGFFNAKPFLGERASKAALKPLMANRDIVHLACHGVFDVDEPLKSYVSLAGAKQPEKELTALEIMGLELRAELVVLSACQTGRSAIRKGDELVGLTRAFLYAGASSALVSLWDVADESTAQLMADFYGRLYDKQERSAESKAVALQKAMLELRKVKGHPRYWAPFILVGDWR
jgi:CHAT domain-containing protein